MIKVIVCGLYSCKKQFLEKKADNVSVVGYTSLNKEKLKMVDYKPYYADEKSVVEKVNSNNADYVVVAEDLEEDAENALSYYREILGFEKVIDFTKFHECNFINVWEQYKKCDIDFEAFLFGMSYSHQSLFVHRLNLVTFKFSQPSADLYIHNGLVRKLKEEFPEKIKKCDFYFFDLPYFIFNFKLRACKKIVPIRMNLFDAIEKMGGY